MIFRSDLYYTSSVKELFGESPNSLVLRWVLGIEILNERQHFL